MEQLTLGIDACGVADAAVLPFPASNVSCNTILKRASEHGTEALSVAELIAMARTPNPTDDDEDRARDMFRQCGSLRECVKRDMQLAASAELAARALRESLETRSFTSPRDSMAFLKAQLGHKTHEVFAVLWLDNRHRLIRFQQMFNGTVDGASVHVREVVRAALACNACACIVAHNHPLGVAEPSAADRNITRQLRDALQLVGVRVLDHIVVGADEPTSMVARGLI